MATTSTSAFAATEGELIDEICVSIEQRRRSFNYDHYYHTTEHGSWILDTCRPLLDAIMDGDWESAEGFIQKIPFSVEFPITVCGRTALHIAAGAAHSEFVSHLIKIMSVEALELKDSYDGNTALHLAVIAGLDEAVRAMVQKNRNLTRICNKKGLNPLLNAAIHITVEHKDIIRFLCGVMKDEDPSSFQGHLGAHLICSITRAGLYELAYTLIHEHPNLAIAREADGNTMLDVLAEMGSAKAFTSSRYASLSFQSHTQQYELIDKLPRHLKVWYSLNPGYNKALRIERLRTVIVVRELVERIFKEISLMTEIKKYHFFFGSNFLKIAAEKGAIEIVKKCISIYPDQLWFPHEGRNIFQIAVESRKEKTFDYLYDHMNADEKILTTRIVDSNGGNILHVAAKFVPSIRTYCGLQSSPVYQMQSEIKWFKKVEKRVPPALRKVRNNQGETPREVFTREHKDLVIEAETYMFRVAESCLIVAALVATVAFAAVFTVPGGNFSDSDATNKGKPIFLEKKSFLLFLVVDALALFSSAYSIQVFLTFFTRSYDLTFFTGCDNAEARFEKLIPQRLNQGLLSLRISAISVTIAFSIALSIMLENRYAWAPYLLGGAAFYSCRYCLKSLNIC
ncbi:hypothetical protein MKX03_006057 [Papaver bracteatum]|nr:hypothetical protein MKX03_006057 [Papaver bracteatum]